MAIPLRLDRRVVLVSGGSRGIGAASVRAFAAAGARVFFNYARARAQAERLVAECVSEYGHDCCATVACDLNNIANSGELVRECVEKFGRLDVLVANHGVWEPEDVSIDRMSAAQWRRTLAINLDSVFGLVKHAVAQMKAQPRAEGSGPAGHIVLVSSSSGQVGEPFHADYAATKGALISMTKGIATELAPAILVNCVAPGWVETELVAPALADRRERERVERNIPLGRLGRPEDIASAILFLCTEHAGFVTGEVLNVNGGEALVG